jgi:ABC-2 type transport system permease protein
VDLGAAWRARQLGHCLRPAEDGRRPAAAEVRVNDDVRLFIALGLVSGNAQAAQALSSLIVVPLSFVSGAFVPIGSMPGWMQAFAAHQPVTVIINAVRSLMLGGTHAAGIGHSTTYWVLLSLVWCAGILAVFGAIAVTRFSRTR